MDEPCIYRISMKGIVVDEQGRLLLTREDNGKWELLGGGLDFGEDPMDGLRREIAEETGLTVTWVSPTPKYFTTSLHSNGKRYIANVVYEVKLANLDFTPSDECEELRFCTVEEARQLPLFENVSKLLDVFDPALHR